jgi:transposase-like protein
MDWPDAPVEAAASFSFWPPFCPWPDCSQHRLPEGGHADFHRHGAFRRPSDGARIPRYRCLFCRRTCSRQTFSCTYYLKRRELSSPIAAALEAGSAHRQIARSLGCAASSVTLRAARLGRHAMLLLARALRCCAPLDEAVVVDHFETFAFSQDFPFGIGTAVGARSWFVYGLDPAPHEPGGPRRRRSRAEPPDRRGGYQGSFSRLLDTLLPLTTVEAPLDLITDGHASYVSAIEQHARHSRVHHHRYPNPPRRLKGARRTPEARRRDAAMFPVDVLHLILRHTCAHHRRETIAFGRRLNALMERMFLTAVWRNFVKRRSERKPDPPVTPAMERGLTGAPWSWGKVLAQRLFPTRATLPAAWKELYERSWNTPAVGNNRRHALARAY